MFPTLVAVLLAVVTPTPAPTQLPEIYHTVTSEQCTTLHKTTLPIGYVAKHNDAAFKAMGMSLLKFVGDIYPTDVPSAAEINAAGLNPASVDAEAEGLGSDKSDDELLYGPGQILTAARIDSIAQQIYGNITLENQVMKESWANYPQGADPKVDAMRQRLQNLIDLQRALVDRYEQFAGTYLTNQGMAGIGTSNHTDLKLFLRALLLGQVAALTGVEDPNSDADAQGVAETTKYGDVAHIVQSLRAEEQNFAVETIAASNHCDGTHIIFTTPAPEPSPTP